MTRYRNMQARKKVILSRLSMDIVSRSVRNENIPKNPFPIFSMMEKEGVNLSKMLTAMNNMNGTPAQKE